MAERPIPNDLRISWTAAGDDPAGMSSPFRATPVDDPPREPADVDSDDGPSLALLVERVEQLTDEVASLRSEARERVDAVMEAIISLREDFILLARHLDPSREAVQDVQALRAVGVEAGPTPSLPAEPPRQIPEAVRPWSD